MSFIRFPNAPSPPSVAVAYTSAPFHQRNHHKDLGRHKSKQKYLLLPAARNFCDLVDCKMEYIRRLEPWFASWSILLDPVHLFSNATVKLNDFKEDVVDVWRNLRNDDWQIRLSWFLLICTAFNVIFIGIAWNIYGETISKMFFNKSRSPVHKRSKTNVLSGSMEELIVKKIQ